jgi:hypothetical protein
MAPLSGVPHVRGPVDLPGFRAGVSGAPIVERTGAAYSALAATASRALVAAARTGSSYSNLDATASRTLSAAPRSGSAYSNLDASASRALTLSSTGGGYSNLDIATSRALTTARTSNAASSLDASASGTTTGAAAGSSPGGGGGSAGGFVSQELIDALPWPEWVRGSTTSMTGAARLTTRASAARVIIETEDDAAILAFL